MPSEKKTEKLKLNQWQENEYPKMMDFNDDNKKIDDAYIKLIQLIEELNIDIENIDISDDLNKLEQELIHLIKKAGKVDTVNNIEADENKNITLNIENIPKLEENLSDIGFKIEDIVEKDIPAIRDDKNKVLRVQVATSEPAPEDGRIYYNSKDKLFYVARNGQWYRLFVGGDEKLEQKAPINPPTLEKKTDTTVTLKSNEDMEFRYQGGAWQESNYFAGLQRNETYRFECRYKSDDVYKVSPSSPYLSVTTNKGTQSAPSKPNISNLEHDRATVNGGSNTEVRLDSGAWFSSPHTFTGLNEKTRYTAYARRKETNTHKPSPSSSGTSFTTPAAHDDSTNSPGNKDLIAGDINQGFFGEVPVSEFIRGDELCNRLGITQGTNQFSNEPWLKFALDGKTLFRPKKAIRHSISWNHIDDKNCIYGDRTIEIDGVKYKVRLMKGASTDPSEYDASDRGAKGSEWNRLMLPISVKAKDKSWDYPECVEDDIPYWGIDYTDSDLQIGSGNGRRVWCQEKTNKSGNSRVRRGDICASYSDYGAPYQYNSNVGFAPILEVVE